MLSLKNITKTYSGKDNNDVKALRGVSINFPQTGMVFLLGKSGSGKSTLLNIIGGLDRFNEGEITICGKSSDNFSRADFDSYRNTFIGFIFQEYNLLDDMTVGENIALALSLQGRESDKSAVDEILKVVDLEGMADRKPNTLSGGQKQRIAIARALIKEPKIIMADEPTGALDSINGKQIFDLLKELSKKQLVIIVSHDREFAEVYADRIIELADGVVVSDLKRNADNNFTNVEIIGSNVTIGDVDNVTERDVKKIITALKENDGEMTITKKKKKAIESQNDDVVEEVYQGNVEFIRSKLPTKNTVKIGASSLISKPSKLVFTVILTMISFALFGVLSALMLYSSYYSVSEALIAGGYTNTIISKNYEYDEYLAEVHDGGNVYREVVDPESATRKETQALFSKAEIEQLNDTDKGVEYAGVFSFAPSYKKRTYSISGLGLKPDYHLYYQSRNLHGFSDCGEEYLLRNGAVKLAGEYPKDSSEIALSEYFINLLYDSSFYNFKSQPKDYAGILEELRYRRVELGQVRRDINIISDNGIMISVNVVGVYGFSDLEPYQEIRGKKYTELPITYRETKSANLKKIVEGFDSIGYVSEDFYAQYSHYATDHLSTPPIVTISGVRYGELDKVEGKVDGSSIQYAYTPNVCRDDMYRFTFYDCDGNIVEYKENKNEIYLSKKLFNELRDEVGGLEKLKESPFHVKSTGDEYELSIAGFYVNVGQVRSGIIFFSDEFVYEVGRVTTFRRNNVDTKYQQTEGAMYEYVVTAVDGSISQCKMILADRDTYFFKMENEEYRRLYDGEIIETLNDLKVIFTVASIVIGLFSALMLYNFISSSISSKKKEIGILRALGAGGKDVLRIFLCETIILTAICFVFATIFAIVGSYVLNYALVYFFETKVLRFRFVNVLIMLAVAIFISTVGTFLPVLKEAKKSPAEGIRQI